MREDFLHFVWKYKKFKSQDLRTVSGETISIVSLGQHNHLAGPDFFNAKIEIDGQLWAGNVEIHLKSSDWYAHHHENDVNYNNVILHVVWEDDSQVFRQDNTLIACMELKKLVDPDLIHKYKALMHAKKFINCEKDFASIDDFTKGNWLERIFVERLAQKSAAIFELLEDSQSDWEKVLFCTLMKNFGLNINGPVFLEIAKSIDYAVFRKVKHDLLKSESLLLGMNNLLNDEPIDSYHSKLKKEYQFLSNKFGLNAEFLPKPNFYGLRPGNFPTIRLSQMANVYVKNENLFEKLIKAKNVDDVKAVFEIEATDYWDSHYVFGKTSKKRKKKLSHAFVELLVINTVLPIQFSYAKYIGKSMPEQIFDFAKSLRPESNSIIKKFKEIGSKAKDAFDTQSKIELHATYCSKNKCLKCAIGNKLLLNNG